MSSERIKKKRVLAYSKQNLYLDAYTLPHLDCFYFISRRQPCETNKQTKKNT